MRKLFWGRRWEFETLRVKNLVLWSLRCSPQGRNIAWFGIQWSQCSSLDSKVLQVRTIWAHGCHYHFGDTNLLEYNLRNYTFSRIKGFCFFIFQSVMNFSKIEDTKPFSKLTVIRHFFKILVVTLPQQWIKIVSLFNFRKKIKCCSLF